MDENKKQEIRQAFAEHNSVKFNRLMAAEVPVRNGCISLADICDKLDEVFHGNKK